MLAVTLSGSSGNDSTQNKIVNIYLQITTDVNNKCIESFAGTSSAASLATGIIALMLQAKFYLS